MDRKLTEFKRLYKSTISENLASIDKIIDDVKINGSVSSRQFEEALNKSCCNLTDKWISGRKSLRTEIAHNIIPEYPAEILKISLVIDSIINLLDDSLDELMEKPERALYVIELVRALALFNKLNISSEAKERIFEYFNKILVIAISEILYEEKIKMSDSFEKQVDYSIKCYDCKCLVMDIFVELPLIELHGCKNHVKEITRLARIHRALYQIKKDFRDLERDLRNQTETPIVILSTEGKGELGKYIDAMIGHYEQEASNIGLDGHNSGCHEIICRLKELISSEISDYRT